MITNQLLSIVIPVNNEADSLPQLIEEIKHAALLLPLGYELIIVDDGSHDATWKIIVEHSRQSENIHGLRLRQNYGKTAAYLAGFASAKGQYIVTLDGDLQDVPAEIPRLFDYFQQKFDLVVGWKQARKDSLAKRLASMAFNIIVNRFSHAKLHDHNSGFKIMTKEVADQLPLWGERHRFMVLLAAQMGYRVGELPVSHRPRQYGRSHYGWRRVLNSGFDLLGIMAVSVLGQTPIRFFGLTTVFAWTLACIFSIMIYFNHDSLRPTNIIILAAIPFLFFLGMITLCAGILAEYIICLSEKKAKYRIMETAG